MGVGAYFVDGTYTFLTTSLGGISVDEVDTTFGIRPGLGVNYYVTQNIFIGVEGKYSWANPEFETLGSPDIDGIVAEVCIGLRF